MSPLFETIRIARGRLWHAAYHTARMNGSRRALFGYADSIDLEKAVTVPAGPGDGVLRCRVDYGEGIDGISITPYVRKNVNTLRMVEGEGLDYAHKYSDRSAIDRLLAGAGTDDILIVRNGLVTDASYANVAFSDGDGWLTPASPLLAGTTRARLLDEGLIRTAEIRADRIGDYGAVVLMNAMLGIDLDHPVPVERILRP